MRRLDLLLVALLVVLVAFGYGFLPALVVAAAFHLGYLTGRHVGAEWHLTKWRDGRPQPRHEAERDRARPWVRDS